MAGSGWRAWTRERVPSAWLQSFLQDQVVQNYTSRAARTATGPAVPTEGMASWLQDENVLEVYLDGAWSTPWALGMVPDSYRHVTTTMGSTDGTSSEVRFTGVLNYTVALKAGRLYRAQGRGKVNGTAAGSVVNWSIRCESGADNIAGPTAPVVAAERAAISNAGGPGQSDVAPEGLFRVTQSGDFSISTYGQASSGTLSILTDNRGRVDVFVEDVGPWRGGDVVSVPG